MLTDGMRMILLLWRFYTDKPHSKLLVYFQSCAVFSYNSFVLETKWNLDEQRFKHSVVLQTPEVAFNPLRLRLALSQILISDGIRDRILKVFEGHSSFQYRNQAEFGLIIEISLTVAGLLFVAFLKTFCETGSFTELHFKIHFQASLWKFRSI